MSWGQYSTNSLKESSTGNTRIKDLIVTGNIWLTGNGNIILGKYSGNYDIPESPLKSNEINKEINGTIVLGPGKSSTNNIGAAGKYSLENFIQLLLEKKIVEYFNPDPIESTKDKNITTTNINNTGTITTDTIDINALTCKNNSLYLHSDETILSGVLALENGFIKNADDNGDINILSDTNIKGDLKVKNIQLQNLEPTEFNKGQDLVNIIKSLNQRITLLEKKLDSEINEINEIDKEISEQNRRLDETKKIEDDLESKVDFEDEIELKEGEKEFELGEREDKIEDEIENGIESEIEAVIEEIESVIEETAEREDELEVEIEQEV